MKSEEIEVVIDPEGEVRITVRGVKGKGCVDLTRALEDELGGELGKRVLTSEYYEDPTAKETIADPSPKLRRD